MQTPIVTPRAVVEGELLWTPSAAFVESSRLRAFERWLEERRGLRFADYAALWSWSVGEPDAFWAALWDFFEVESSTPYVAVRSGAMPRTRWFTGSRVNYAEHLSPSRATSRSCIPRRSAANGA
jgi:acetoacetyl-CoA synthetase